MTNLEVINQLECILEYSRDMMKGSDVADVWEQDVIALQCAIDIISKL